MISAKTRKGLGCLLLAFLPALQQSAVPCLGTDHYALVISRIQLYLGKCDVHGVQQQTHYRNN
jgi:hypothetical protein